MGLKKSGVASQSEVAGEVRTNQNDLAHKTRTRKPARSGAALAAAARRAPLVVRFLIFLYPFSYIRSRLVSL